MCSAMPWMICTTARGAVSGVQSAQWMRPAPFEGR